MPTDVRLAQPFGLRTPTARCHWDEAGGSTLADCLQLEPAIEIADYQRPDYADTAEGVHLLAATGRDQLHVTDLRHMPGFGRAAASARLTGLHQWITISVREADLAALGTGARQVSSLWLSAIIALREEAIQAESSRWLWLLSLDDSQRVELRPDGRIHAEEVPTGLNRLIDLVQREMSLHFRASAFDLLFNEEFDWEDAPATILSEFVAPLREVTSPALAEDSLAIVGLGPRLTNLASSVARHVGMSPWQATLFGAHLSTPLSFEAWLLRRVAQRKPEDGPRFAIEFDGAPLLLPRRELSDPADAEETTEASRESPGSRRSGSGARGSRRRQRRTGPGRSRAPRPRRGDDISARKVIFVVLWVVVVAIAGHLLVDQSTEQAREAQEYGNP